MIYYLIARTTPDGVVEYLASVMVWPHEWTTDRKKALMTGSLENAERLASSNAVVVKVAK